MKFEFEESIEVFDTQKKKWIRTKVDVPEDGYEPTVGYVCVWAWWRGHINEFSITVPLKNVRKTC